MSIVARQHLNVCMVDELCLLPHKVPERVLHAAPCLVKIPDADTGLIQCSLTQFRDRDSLCLFPNPHGKDYPTY